MAQLPNTENGSIVMSKDTLDLVRAIEREKMRRSLMAAVMPSTRQYQPLLEQHKTVCPAFKDTYYKN